MISVKFKREREGLLIRAVYVAGERLVFDDNDVATKDLELGSLCDIHWRIVGPSGSELVIVKTVNGTDQEIVRSEIPDGTDRVSDFTVFRV